VVAGRDLVRGGGGPPALHRPGLAGGAVGAADQRPRATRPRRAARPVLDGLLQPDPAHRITASQAADMLATIAAGRPASAHRARRPAWPSRRPAGELRAGRADPDQPRDQPVRPGRSRSPASLVVGRCPRTGPGRQKPTGRRLRRPVVLLAAGASVAVAAVLAAVLLAMPGKDAAAGPRRPAGRHSQLPGSRRGDWPGNRSGRPRTRRLPLLG
jgi:hypothetical protein